EAKHAAADRFAQAHDVGLDVEMLAGEDLPRAAEPTRYFVHHQQRSIAATEFLELRHEQRVGNEHTQIHAHRLHNERGDVAAFEARLDFVERLFVEWSVYLMAEW